VNSWLANRIARRDDDLDRRRLEALLEGGFPSWPGESETSVSDWRMPFL